MTLPFTWMFWGLYKDINWPNFNIVVSQEIERPQGERESDKETGSQWRSQNIDDIYWSSSPSSTGTVCSASKH